MPFALKTHVSELVKTAPASAHLQSKFKADLLKVMSLFEIQERKPMPQYSRWCFPPPLPSSTHTHTHALARAHTHTFKHARTQSHAHSLRAAKVRQTPFTLKNTIKTAFSQFFALSSGGNSEFTRLPVDDPGHQPDALDSSGVQECFKTYLFKTIDTKFVRKVSFTNIALEQSLKLYNNTHLEPGLKPTISAKDALSEFKKDKCIEFGLEELQVLHSSRPDDTAVRSKSQQLEVQATLVNDENGYVLQVTDTAPELSSKIFDYVVVKSRDPPCDPRFGYVIRNVRQTADNVKTFELFSLDDGFHKLDLSTAPITTVTLKFEDPYVIEDNFIDYAFRANAFEYQNLVSGFNRIYSSSDATKPVTPPNCFAKCLRSCCGCFFKSGASQKEDKTSLTRDGKQVKVETGIPMTPRLTDDDGTCTFGAPVFQSNEVLKWNPFRDRIILTTTAIFFESVESYRCISSSTGVESFFDLLIINGSENLRKWTMLGSIDDIMNAFHNKKMPETSRIPAVFQPSDKTDKTEWAIRCMKSDVADRLKRMAQSTPDVDSYIFDADFSLHGPAVSSKDAIQLIGSNDMFHQSIIVHPSQKLFSEKLEWQPFQPGCIFVLERDAKKADQGATRAQGSSALDGKFVRKWDDTSIASVRRMADNSITVSGDTRTVPDITVQFVDVPDKEKAEQYAYVPKTTKQFVNEIKAPNCHMHTQCFQALQKRVEEISSGEDGGKEEGSRVLYSHQFLDAYKPKGKAAIISPFIHCTIAVAAVVPTFMFFGLLAYNQLVYYSMILYWSLATYFLIFAIIYVFIGVYYFFCVYLEFPYLFYGTSLVSYKINHFFFSPLTGAWCAAFTQFVSFDTHYVTPASAGFPTPDACFILYLG